MLEQSVASDDGKVGRSGYVLDGCVRRQAGRHLTKFNKSYIWERLTPMH